MSSYDVDVHFDVEERDDPGTIQFTGSESVNEDSKATLTAEATDADGINSARINAEANNGSVSITLYGHTGTDTVSIQMEYEPDPNFFGSDVLKLEVEDYRGRKKTAIKTIEVNNVNDVLHYTIGTFQAAENIWTEITYGTPR